MNLEYAPKKDIKFLVLLILTLFLLDFFAVWFFDFLKQQDKTQQQLVLCGNLSDPDILKKFSLEDITKCSNISGMEIKLKLNIDKESE